MLNAQLIAVSNCKASRQLHSYHSCLGDVHRLIVLNDLCILGIAVQFNLVCRICGGRYHAVLRSDLQRQRLGCLVIRGRLNLQSRLNVQLLVAGYLVCLFNQFIRLAFVDLLCFINSSRAEGRCGNRCRCCSNLFLICLRNLVYLNFRLGNRRLDLNIAGFGLFHYLVAVTGYITGSGNVAACNVVARVGGEVAASNNNTAIRIRIVLYNFNRINIGFEFAVINLNLGIISQRRIFCRAIKYQCRARYYNTRIANFTRSIAGRIKFAVIYNDNAATRNNACAASNIKSTAVYNNIVLPRRIDTTSNIAAGLNHTVECAAIDSNLIGIYTFRGSLCILVSFISITRNYRIIQCRKYAIFNGDRCTRSIAGNNRAFLCLNISILDCCGRVMIYANTYIARRYNLTGLVSRRILYNQRAAIIQRSTCMCHRLTVQIQHNIFICRNYSLTIDIRQKLNGCAALCCCNSVSQRLIIGIANLSYRIGFTQSLNSAVILNVTLCNICRNIRGECTASHGNLSLS